MCVCVCHFLKNFFLLCGSFTSFVVSMNLHKNSVAPPPQCIPTAKSGYQTSRCLWQCSFPFLFSRSWKIPRFSLLFRHYARQFKFLFTFSIFPLREMQIFFCFPLEWVKWNVKFSWIKSKSDGRRLMDVTRDFANAHKLPCRFAGFFFSLRDDFLLLLSYGISRNVPEG